MPRSYRCQLNSFQETATALSPAVAGLEKELRDAVERRRANRSPEVALGFSHQAFVSAL